MEKIRLDIALCDKNLASSREKAKALIMAGSVYVNGERADKAGQSVCPEDTLEVRGNTLRYVSRGGLKLEKAMQTFPISLEGAICMDAGASTGGFTDCMLQNGAQKVYAVDVGYGQLAWSLRNDSRVVNLERHNIRHLTHEEIPDLLDFVSVDVSFISLTLVLPVIQQFLKPGAELVCLIKPQFEIGKGRVGKKGVVRDLNDHIEVIQKVYGFCIEHGLHPAGLTYSPVKGPEGNIEYLLYLRSQPLASEIPLQMIQDVVEQSHQDLNAGV